MCSCRTQHRQREESTLPSSCSWSRQVHGVAAATAPWSPDLTAWRREEEAVRPLLATGSRSASGLPPAPPPPLLQQRWQARRRSGRAGAATGRPPPRFGRVRGGAVVPWGQSGWRGTATPHPAGEWWWWWWDLGMGRGGG
ncbi:Os12g0110975 [Oryza sativa Japonica Group]|uniref:Os12g0110975 protein n=1 Tax=Oryza sativa subsp. japonica TaxID=39947 RepID=A0A0P0Y656_ORYSJ|nr:Os12g0110975 [Oryza sativa Japonica Group]